MDKFGLRLSDIWATDDYWQAFKPYFQLGRIFGSCYKLSAMRWRLAYKTYCTMNFLLIVYNMGRGISFLKFDGFSSVLVFKILLLLYATHCMGAYLFMIWLQATEGLGSFIRNWRTLNKDCPNPPYIIWIQRITICGITYALGISVVNGVFVALGSMDVLIKFPFMASYFIHPKLKIANGFNVFFTCVTFSLSQAVFCSVCAVVSFEFVSFSNDLNALSPEESLIQLRDNRWKHMQIIKLTDQADSLLSYYALAIFSLNSPTLVITAFLLARDKELLDPASLFTFVTWLMVLLLQIGVVSVLPAIINYLAHKPLSHLQHLASMIETRSIYSTCDDLRAVLLFIRQLTDRQISITGGGFFVIDKAMLLTLFSGIFTYFTVLLQFDMATKLNCLCNCTYIMPQQATFPRISPLQLNIAV